MAIITVAETRPTARYLAVVSIRHDDHRVCQQHRHTVTGSACTALAKAVASCPLIPPLTAMVVDIAVLASGDVFSTNSLQREEAGEGAEKNTCNLPPTAIVFALAGKEPTPDAAGDEHLD